MKKWIVLVIVVGLVALANAQRIGNFVGPYYNDGQSGDLLIGSNKIVGQAGASAGISVDSSGNATLGATLTAEQLTSTDDAYIAGQLGVGDATPDYPMDVEAAAGITIAMTWTNGTLAAYSGMFSDGEGYYVVGNAAAGTTPVLLRSDGDSYINGGALSITNLAVAGAGNAVAAGAAAPAGLIPGELWASNGVVYVSQ